MYRDEEIHQCRAGQATPRQDAGCRSASGPNLGTRHARARLRRGMPAPMRVDRGHGANGRRQRGGRILGTISADAWDDLGSTRRGDIVVVALQGDSGKPRPALVIQADWFDALPTMVVLPVIGSLVQEAAITRIGVAPGDANGLRVPSQIAVDRPPTIRRTKIGPTIGRLDNDVMLAVHRTLAVFLGWRRQSLACYRESGSRRMPASLLAPATTGRPEIFQTRPATSGMMAVIASFGRGSGLICQPQGISYPVACGPRPFVLARQPHDRQPIQQRPPRRRAESLPQ